MKMEYRSQRKQSKNGSIWDGVLDINNIIKTTSSIPRWRPRFSFQQNQLLQEGLLNSVLATISPKSYQYGANQSGLHDELQLTTIDAMCLFLPFICVISSKLSGKISRKQLQSAILQRVQKEDDVKQHFEFFLNAYKKETDLKKSFSKMNALLLQQNKNSNESTDSLPSFSRSSSSLLPSMGMGKGSNKKMQKITNIIQQEPESAISLFSSIFRQQLAAGSEIKLCRESQVRDPIHCNAPPLSRIEIRKVIQTNSKPYLVDLYVANRGDNFEYLSSTVILKKGDDLRRDCAVLHVFRLMNKIWREKGLEFTQVPVNAMTYKCIAMSPDFGLIELIESCRPLRLVSALEDSITIQQQFNLVASAAGSYMASYVMGVRDRHFDNVLIQSDGTLFHIDFGYVMGTTLLMDTSKIAITNDLCKLFEDHWDNFIETAVNSYMTLRLHYQEILDFSDLVFDFLDLEVDSSEFLYKMLMMHETDKKAEDRIRYKLQSAPSSWNTKIKNATHYLATL